MSMDIDSKPSSVPYRLSFQLNSFTAGVRDLAICNDQMFAAIEERGRTSVFDRDTPNGRSFSRRDLFHDRTHESLTYVIECVRGNQANATNYPPFTLISGGQDKAARPYTANQSFLEPLTGHGNSVNSISVSPSGSIFTGCWDGIVREFKGAAKAREFLAGEHAIEVLCLPDGRFVTGSANKILSIWSSDGRKVKTIQDAHDHSIRKLVLHPMGFASAGNDGFIKVWSSDGDCLVSIPAHQGEVKFMYGLAINPNTDELISCGEDGNVKVWDITGKCIQSIAHPGPVKSVKVLPNGDLLSGSADKMVRIWSRSPDRAAPEEEIVQYEEGIQMILAAGMKSLDADSLPDESALTVPGTRDGQVKVVNTSDRGPMAYQWSDEAQTWVERGQAIGKSNKQVLDGQEFDFVTDVYVTEEQKVKLGFNRDDDPEEVATRFCAIYALDHDVKQQIIEHVRPMTDARAIEEKKARLAKLEEENLRQLPGWKQGGFEIYAAANLKAMKERIVKSNAEFHAAHEGSEERKHAIAPNEARVLDQLFNNLTEVKEYHNAQLSKDEAALARRLMHWPPNHALPVIDMYRVLMVHAGGNAALGLNRDIHSAIKAQLSAAANETPINLFIKAASNWIAKRERTPVERSASPQIPPAELEWLKEIFDLVAPIARQGSEAAITNLVLLLHNAVSWLGRLRIAASPAFEWIVRAAIDILGNEISRKNSKILYYALLSVGSAAFISPSVKQHIVERFGSELNAITNQSLSNENPAVREVASDCRKLLKLK